VSSTAFEIRGEIAKLDRSRRMAFGWAATSPDGESIVLDGGEAISLDELEQSAYRLMQNQPKGDGSMIESFVMTKEKREVLGLPASSRLGWWVGLQFAPGESWDAILKGITRTFRVRGKGLKTSPSLKNKLLSKEVTDVSTASAARARIEARARELENDGLAPVEAFKQAMGESPELMKVYREQRDAEAEEVESPFEKAARVERERLAKLDRSPALKRFYGKVEQIAKQNPNLTEAEAFRRAGEERPDLYAAARRETR
jgi:hypothetical protein